MPTTRLALIVLAFVPAPARAGLHYSGETFAELPSKWKGFLTDHRALRALGQNRPNDLPSPLRDEYAAALAKLEQAARQRALTADESADLGALHVRTGNPEKAVEILRPAARAHPEHFRLAANLGTAWQLAGDPEQAAAALGEAVRLAPPKLRDAERLHLKLVRLRLKETRAAADAAPDDLFGVKYVGESGKPEPGKMAAAEVRTLPDGAIPAVQRLALWLPADGRLLWQLGELANMTGDVTTAAAILDGCVTEFALASADLRARRQLYRAAADEQAKKPEHERHRVTFTAASPRPLVRKFDASQLPPVRADGPNTLPWAVLTETALDRNFRPTFLKHLEQLEGKRVVLTGFMQPLRDEAELSGFLLVEYPVGCWFCETPEPTGVVGVTLAVGKPVRPTRGLVKVEGVLALNRTDPEEFLYTLKDARVGQAD
jgi:tetratricopeptide (TPR) repeat protein